MKKIQLLCIALCLHCVVWCQTAVSLHLSSSRIGIDDILEATYTIQNAGDDINAPNINFNGWRLMAGPQTSQQTSIVNGNVSSAVSFTYALKPLRKGRLGIPGIAFHANGKNLTAASQYVTVMGGGSGRASTSTSAGALAQSGMPSLQSLLDDMEDEMRAPNQNVFPSGVDPRSFIKKHMFVRAEISNSNCYVGQPVLVTFKLYANLACTAKVTRQPSFGSVGVVDLTKEEPKGVAMIGGEQYNTYVIRRVQLTPLQAGKIDVGNVGVTGTVSYQTAHDFRQNQTLDVEVENPATYLNVRALPAGQPANFSGAIGDFTITSSVKMLNLPANDDNNLHIEIAGEGNLQGVSLPSIAWPSVLQSFDATDNLNVDKDNLPIRVTKTFDVPFIGTQEGNFTIPSISFSYFDPKTSTYKTIHTEPINIHLSKAVKANPRLETNHENDKTWLQWLMIAFVILVVVVLVLVIRSKAKRNKRASLPKDQKPISEIGKTPSENSKDPFLVRKASPKVAVEKTMEDSSIVVPPPIPVSNAATIWSSKSEMDELLLERNDKNFYAGSKSLILKYLKFNTENPEFVYSDLEKYPDDYVFAGAPIANWKGVLADLEKAIYSPFSTDDLRHKIEDELKMLLKK